MFKAKLIKGIKSSDGVIQIIDIEDDLGELYLQITVQKGTIDDVNKIGIHLMNPSEFELMDAIEGAERDNFSTIYVYRSRPVLKLVA